MVIPVGVISTSSHPSGAIKRWWCPARAEQARGPLSSYHLADLSARLACQKREVVQPLEIGNFEIAELCKGVHCVALGESFPTHIYSQSLTSIQPRTSPVKFARSTNAPRSSAAGARAGRRRSRGGLRAGSGTAERTAEGSCSAVSKPNFPTKYALDSSRRDLHNALLCTVLDRSQSSTFCLKIAKKLPNLPYMLNCQTLTFDIALNL